MFTKGFGQRGKSARQWARGAQVFAVLCNGFVLLIAGLALPGALNWNTFSFVACLFMFVWALASLLIALSSSLHLDSIGVHFRQRFRSDFIAYADLVRIMDEQWDGGFYGPMGSRRTRVLILCEQGTRSRNVKLSGAFMSRKNAELFVCEAERNSGKSLGDLGRYAPGVRNFFS